MLTNRRGHVNDWSNQHQQWLSPQSAQRITCRRKAGYCAKPTAVRLMQPERLARLPTQILTEGILMCTIAGRKPTLAIDAVYAVKLSSALLELIAQRCDHAVILPVEEASLAGRKTEQRHATVAEDQELHDPHPSKNPLGNLVLIFRNVICVGLGQSAFLICMHRIDVIYQGNGLVSTTV